jgi:xylose isomerase
VDPEDLFLAHIGGMDSFAVGLEIAWRVIKDGKIPGFVKTCYSSYDSGDGARFEAGALSLEDLAQIGATAGYGKTGISSGRQEYLENILNQCLLGL